EEVQIAVPAADLGRLPRELVAFAQDFDLRLVELERPAAQRWRAMLAWGDAQGRQRFLALRIEGDYYSGLRRLLKAREQLAGDSPSRFIRDLLHGLEHGAAWEKAADAWLSALWADDPRGAIEAIARFWRSAADIRLIGQAAKHGEWAPVREAASRLRLAAAKSSPFDPTALGAHLVSVIGKTARPSIAFTGRESVARTSVLAQVSRDLAPLRLVLFEDRPGDARKSDFR